MFQREYVKCKDKDYYLFGIWKKKFRFILLPFIFLFFYKKLFKSMSESLKSFY